MPSLDTLRTAYERKLPHDSAPEQCDGCPNLEISTTELGRRKMNCRLVDLLLQGVASYERRGGNTLETNRVPVTVGHIFNVASGELPPFQDEHADDDRVAFYERRIQKLPEGSYERKHPLQVTPIKEQSVDYSGDTNRYRLVKLGEHRMKLLDQNSYDAARHYEAHTDMTAELYPVALVEAITESPEDCPVITNVLSQATAVGVTGTTRVQINDPIQHRSA